MARHMFIISRYDMDFVRTLFGSAIDGQYLVLNESDGYADIAQYSARYDTVKVLTVRSDRLNRMLELEVK